MSSGILCQGGEILFHGKNVNRTFCTIFKMVPEGITFALFLPKSAILKKECKKEVFNSFVMMQFS